MNPQELRIGNWVHQKDHGKCLVLGMPKKGEKLELGYFEDSVGFERRIGTTYPIPLNEQWLEDFWFEKPAHSWIGDVFHLTGYDKEYGDKNSYLVAMNKNNAILRNVQHVHELQNLFWCLTGQELELKEPKK